MDDLSQYAHRPLSLLLRFIKSRRIPHIAILICVLGAVGFSTSTQYGVKYLVDILSKPPGETDPWSAFALISFFIAADHMLWRVAGWIAAHTFVHVTGDLRRALFRHLMDHSPRYFADRSAGVLTSRITATSNACFTIENMFIWNVLPPCVAVFAAIAFISQVNLTMAAGLFVVAGIIMVAMFKIAANGKPLHHDFAGKAATVDGEMNDVIGNILLVRAFGGFRYEQRRYAHVVDREMKARRLSLLYIEKLRLLHAWITVILILCLLAWAIALWQRGEVTTGQVILVCTLGISVLHATRDLAVALVDVTQHMARLSEAVATLLVPHELQDHPTALPFERAGAGVAFKDVTFGYRPEKTVINHFSLDILPGQRVGLIGPSGGGKSTLLALLQRHHDLQGGQILLDGQDISRLTRDSLQQAIAVVPQDISLFHRSLMENIRYGCPDATDEEVWKAAVAAHCDEFIKALPEGFDTTVGDRGLKLSGGQRQRIALARAFLKDAPILLLDEATSALDNESEEKIQEASARLMRGRTVIAIAHRLSTLRSFDRLVVLKSGRLIHDGPPSELLDSNGRLAEFLQREMKHSRERDEASGQQPVELNA
jgi:ATP-binding cassette, subfamily B, bacterial